MYGFNGNDTIDGLPLTEVCQRVDRSSSTILTLYNFKVDEYKAIHRVYLKAGGFPYDTEPAIKTFNLENIDSMRELLYTYTSSSIAIRVGPGSISPYGEPLKHISTTKMIKSVMPLEGIALKTYQSDIFNNWLSSEWIDGDNGINAITSIDTSGGSFTLDTLNLSKKVYDMLNRIAVSGGSYDDWMEAVYTERSFGKAETPVYMGGLSKEVVFNEVVSTAAVNEDNPLGSLAGKGGMSGKHKGGYVTVRCSEPCYIIGIVSLTPRIDYSQAIS